VPRRLYVRQSSRSSSAIDQENVFDISSTPLPPTPTAPQSLIAAVLGSTSVTLSWADLSTNEDGFEIWRCMGSGCVAFVLVGTAPANSPAFLDQDLQPGTTYRYEVRAANRGGGSRFTPPVQVTTLAGSRGARGPD
jgi:hypothetical protein